ncbi:cytochrome P450 81E8-like [Prosopis cineraria]|uniref:cytochrome P450 81E8-like n=1 Tax=Prosopis cineraria TaxID=364024 RepID=UPI00241068B4|nr:cytochrome P450 81E8-like [Prosopis cineraria]
MEDNLMGCSAALCLVIFVAWKIIFRTKATSKNLPPGPPSLPMLGNILQIQRPLFRFFHSLSLKYGPIYTLRFGSQIAVVVSSLSGCQECFTKNDTILANRRPLLKTKHLAYNNKTVVMAPYGDYWRNLRRIISLDVLSVKRINSFLSIRNDEIKLLLRKLCRTCREDYAKVELRSVLVDMSFNAAMRMVWGQWFFNNESDVTDVEEVRRFREVMKESSAFDLGNVESNFGDFVPFFRWIDYKDYQKRLRGIEKRLDDSFNQLIDLYRSKRRGMEGQNTMVEHLLASQETEPEFYTDDVVKALILVMVASDNAAVALEWMMANLVNHPDELQKARDEIKAVVGEERLVQEADVPKLGYIHNIIIESMRLCPPNPFLNVHVASEDCRVEGYDVPRGTMVFVNAYGIHRDPRLWPEPARFKPERYDRGEGDVRNLLSFGMGRRACPGEALSLRTMGLATAVMIQCFDWKRVGEEALDLTAAHGLVMRKATPLEVLCKARPIINKIQSQP